MRETFSSLKRKAKSLYKKATAFDDLSCGRNIAELLRPEIAIAREEFSCVWEKMKNLDPSIPDDPFRRNA